MTKSQLIIESQRYAEAIRAYLIACGVSQDENGFHAVALSGDESAETIVAYEKTYRPLAKLEYTIRRLSSVKNPLERDADNEADWD